MKLTFILTLLQICVIVKGTLLAAVARPVILSFGTMFTALNHDLLDKQTIDWKSLLPFASLRTVAKDENID